MKKLGFIICIGMIYFYVMTTTIYGKSLNHVDVNLEPDDIAVTFLTSENTKLLFVQTQQTKIIIILEAINTVNIKQEFPILTHTNITEYVLLDENIKQKIRYQNVTVLEDSLYFKDGMLQLKNGALLITHDANNLCVIHKNAIDLSTCRYIYYLGLEKEIEIPDSVKLVIYDEGIKDEMRLENYDNFIDTLKLSPHYTSTLLWNTDDYQTMIVP